MNVLADQHATTIHTKQQHCTGLFPDWVPGTRVALYQGSHQITKQLPAYIQNAAHTPAMRAYLICRSQEGTNCNAPWDENIYDSIAWKQLHEVFHKKTIGQRTQLSKFMNDLLPTAKRLQLLDNKNDGRCFACGLLWEDTNHVLQCCCDDRSHAHQEALNQFRSHLLQQHTPDIMATLLCTCMENWISRRQIAPPDWIAHTKLVLQLLTRAFHAQSKIGWDQFFRGRVALAWKSAIQVYYHE